MTFEEWWKAEGRDMGINQDSAEIGWNEAWEAATRAEREACAKVCDGHSADASFLYGDYAAGCENEAAACAAAIRARSNAELRGATDD